jgi:D-arabinose 5-phosphate isomerase GutQ
MNAKTITDLLIDLHGEDSVFSRVEAEASEPIFFAKPYKSTSSLTIDEINGSAWGLIAARVYSISHAVQHTLLLNKEMLSQAVLLVAGWIETDAPVRILGAGRALLAASMPGNRLAHAGAKVSFMGGMVPMPNSTAGGGIIACSASGKTRPVLEAMATAKNLNPKIEVLGLAHHEAKEFAQLCDIFIGLHAPKNEYPNPLSALADTEEYMISEILDGIIVMAGKYVGFDDQAWRRGHEDIGPTGPYAAEKQERRQTST